MIWHIILEYISILMDRHIKENGIRIDSMVKELNTELMAQDIKANIYMGRKMGKVSFFGKTDHIIKVNL